MLIRQPLSGYVSWLPVQQESIAANRATKRGFVALTRWVRICIRSPVTNKMRKTKDAPRKTLPADIGKVLKRLHIRWMSSFCACAGM
jgi:hypothetical protein